jgi:hypothetical protein
MTDKELRAKIRQIMKVELAGTWSRVANLNLADLFQESEEGKVLLDEHVASGFKVGDEYFWGLVDLEAQLLSDALFVVLDSYPEEVEDEE